MAFHEGLCYDEEDMTEEEFEEYLQWLRSLSITSIVPEGTTLIIEDDD